MPFVCCGDNKLWTIKLNLIRHDGELPMYLILKSC